MLESRKYVLTVEGETEKWYFLWLKDQINKHGNRTYNANIIPKVIQSPRSFYKGANSKLTPEIFHICDIESKEPIHIDKFQNILKEMKEARKEKNIKYILGYSNFTFELWIILHKKDCFKTFNNRRQYLASIQECFNEKFEDLGHYKQENAFKRCLDKLCLDDVISAIKRADRLKQLNKESNNKLIKYCNYSYYIENPALSINEVVKRILIECGVM